MKTVKLLDGQIIITTNTKKEGEVTSNLYKSYIFDIEYQGKQYKCECIYTCNTPPEDIALPGLRVFDFHVTDEEGKELSATDAEFVVASDRNTVYKFFYNKAFNNRLDGLTTLLLALACEGVDLEQEAIQRAIKFSFDSLEAM